MAKASKSGKSAAGRTTGRRTRAAAAAKKVQTTIGDLIAAAFDTVGNEVDNVAKLLSSRQLHVDGKRIVLVQ